MAVEDHVVVVFAEFGEPFEEGAEAEVAALFPELDAFEGDDFVEGGVVLDRLGVGVADHPVDLGVWVAGFEGGEDGGRAADVTQRAGADDEDSVWWSRAGHYWRVGREDHRRDACATDFCWLCGVGGAGTVGFPDGNLVEGASEFFQGWGEGLVAVGGDVFDGRDGAFVGLVEGGAVGVEELVVEGVDDGVVDGLFDFELEFWGEVVEWDPDGGFDFVVMAVS